MQLPRIAAPDLLDNLLVPRSPSIPPPIEVSGVRSFAASTQGWAQGMLAATSTTASLTQRCTVEVLYRLQTVRINQNAEN